MSPERTLKNLNFEQRLQDIRQLWGQGKVTPFKNEVIYDPKSHASDIAGEASGFRLASDPYRVIVINRDKEGLYPKLLVRHAIFQVFELLGNGNIILEDRNMSDLRNPVSVQVCVKEVGFPEGLGVLNLNDTHKEVAVFESPINEGLVVDKLFKLALERFKRHSFPSQMQSFTEGLIAQFPEKLSEEGFLTPEELRRWAHDVRGNSELIRFLDRVTPFNIGL